MRGGIDPVPILLASPLPVPEALNSPTKQGKHSVGCGQLGKQPNCQVAVTLSIANAVRKPTARSCVSNGRDILPDVDARSIVAPRCRDILAAVVSDQGGLTA